MTPVTTACPEGSKQMCAKKHNPWSLRAVQFAYGFGVRRFTRQVPAEIEHSLAYRVD